MSTQIGEKLDQFKKQIQRSNEGSLTPSSRLQRNQSMDPNDRMMQSSRFKNDGLEANDTGNAKDLSRFKRIQGEGAGAGSIDDTQVKLKMKKNPNFGGIGTQQQQTYVSSDDDIPVGFSRRKRLSSTSSFQKKFENQAQNLVTIARDEEQPRKRETVYQEANVEEINRDIQRAKDEEEERIHKQTEQVLEKKREEIQQRLREHDEAIRIEKSTYHQSQHHFQQEAMEEQHRQKRHNRDHNNTSQNQANYKQGYMGGYQQPYDQQRSIQMPQMMYAPPPMFNQQPMQNYAAPPQTYMQQQPQYQMQQYPNATNYFPPQAVPNLPQYTNLDIPGHLDASLKQMQETLQKLKSENQSLKGDLNKKQILNADMENNMSTFDKEKYQQHAQANLKLKQQIEDMKRKEIELKSRLSSLQANKQYLHGRTNTLSMDIDQQDKQEDSLNRQINDFNALIRDKESYIKSLMNELNQLKENKEQFSAELQVLSHKEEFLVNELIFKEDQLNEIIMNNDEMKRKIQSGQSQTKYLQAENERLKKEFNQYKEESAVLKASQDFLSNELMGLNEHMNEYEHKLVLSQTTVDQLQRQNQQDKQELAHYNATIANQQKAYEELKNQLSIINDRNQRISMQNEMMMIRQQQQQEQLLMQMSQAQRQMPKEEFGAQTSTADEREFYQEQQHQFAAPPIAARQNIEQRPSQRQNNKQVEIQERQNVVEQQQQQKPAQKQASARQVEKQERQRDGSPYEQISKQQKTGQSMMNTLQWEQEDGDNAHLYQERSSQKDRVQKNADQNTLSQAKSKGQTTMAGLLNWNDDQSENVTVAVTRQSQPAKMEKRKPMNEGPSMRRGDDGANDGEQYGNHERQRSRSAKRQDQMNELMQWAEEDEVRDKRIKQSEEVKYSQSIRERSASGKRKEGQGMSNVLAWNNEQSPFRDRQIMKDAEETMKWKGQNLPLHAQEVSPNQDGKQIRSKHYGQQMAGLLAFQEPDQQLQFSPPNTRQQQQPKVNQQQQKGSNNQPQTSKYGAINIDIVSGLPQNRQSQQQQPVAQNLNISNLKGEEPQYNTPNRGPRASIKETSANKNSQGKRVGIDLKQDIKSGISTPSDGAQKNYGVITEQLHQKVQSRKENLDKFLLQMQIEKDKLASELEKIGDHPRTTQQYRRKEEIVGELQTVNSNISNVKTKLKQLKP